MPFWHRHSGAGRGDPRHAGLGASYVLTAVVGVFTLTGIDVVLTHSADKVLIANVGVFTETGIDANLVRGRTIVAALGTFTHTGIDADFVRGRILAASLGTFTETGISASLTVARQLSTVVGVFTLSGIAVNLPISYTLSLDKGTFVLTGITNSLVYSNAANTIMTADSVSFTYTGRYAELVYGIRATPLFVEKEELNIAKEWAHLHSYRKKTNAIPDKFA